MIENSARGLTLLASDNDVVVTREELHQPALQRYAPRADGRSRQVAVELHITPITHGRHAGEPGIGIRLDGRPVGELTALMAKRYGPLVADATSRGQRLGAEARIGNGPRGIQVTVSLPDLPAGAHAAPPPVPPAPVPPRPRRRATKPLLIGAGVVVGLLVISGILSGRGTPAPATSTAATAATGAALGPQAATTSAAPTTTTPAPAVAAPPAASEQTVVAAAPAAPAATRAVATTPKPAPPAAQPPAAQAPAAQPPAPKPPVAAAPAAPAGGCNSNYSGCVPIASDVDCQGGSGNGPAYVKGPVQVTGTDVYGLDSDNDGTGCE